MSAKIPRPTSNPLGFDHALQQLESLIETLERPDISLTDSLKAFEGGITLTRQAQKSLSEAEQKVQALLEHNGDMISRDFPQGEKVE